MCRALSGAALRTNVNQLGALLLPNALQPITREADLLALDSYLRNLPTAYDVRLDRLSRLVESVSGAVWPCISTASAK